MTVKRTPARKSKAPPRAVAQAYAHRGMTLSRSHLGGGLGFANRDDTMRVTDRDAANHGDESPPMSMSAAIEVSFYSKGGDPIAMVKFPSSTAFLRNLWQLEDK